MLVLLDDINTEVFREKKTTCIWLKKDVGIDWPWLDIGEAELQVHEALHTILYTIYVVL